jgi:hypothetical protein
MPWPPTWPPWPAAEPGQGLNGAAEGLVASLVAFSPQAPGFSVRRMRSTASMAAFIEAEALLRKRGVGDPGGRSARGESLVRVAQLFQREPVS